MLRRHLSHLLFLLCCTAYPSPGVAQDHPGAVLRLSEAIQIPTISHQQADRIDRAPFEHFQQFLRVNYPRVFSQLQVTVISDFSFLLVWKGSDTSLDPVLFEAHYDVVPVEPGTEQDWIQPPFSGAIDDGYLWGRGTLDEKVAVIAEFEALEFLLEQGFVPQRSLYFALGHDEEVGGANGTAMIAKHLQQQGIKFDYIMCEGGMVTRGHPLLPELPVAMIALTQKTYMTLTLTANAAGGHSSNPPQDNALVQLSKAVTALHDNPFEPALVTPVSNMLKSFAPHVGGISGLLFKYPELSAPLLLSQMTKERSSNAMVRTTIAVTMVNGGIKENVIPQQAQAKVNFRLLPGDTPEAVIERVKNIIDDPSISISSEQWQSSPPMADPDGPGFTRTADAIRKVFPNAVVSPGLFIATSDGRHFTGLSDNIYHFQAIIMEYADLASFHGTNERIKVDAIAAAVQIVTEQLKAAASP